MSSPRDPTQFTRESAERIGRVVRAAELATPTTRPLNFERVDFSRSKVFRVATYTGVWDIGVLKIVTFVNPTASPATAVVNNLFFPVTNTAVGNRNCAVAKDGSDWYLVDVRMQTATVVTDVLLAASLNTALCSVSIQRTVVTAAVAIFR